MASIDRRWNNISKAFEYEWNMLVKMVQNVDHLVLNLIEKIIEI